MSSGNRPPPDYHPLHPPHNRTPAQKHESRFSLPSGNRTPIIPNPSLIFVHFSRTKESSSAKLRLFQVGFSFSSRRWLSPRDDGGYQDLLLLAVLLLYRYILLLQFFLNSRVFQFSQIMKIHSIAIVAQLC